MPGLKRYGMFTKQNTKHVRHLPVDSKINYCISGIFGEHYIWRMKVKTELVKD